MSNSSAKRTNTKKIEYSVSLHGKPLFTIFFAPSKNGTVFGIKNGKFGDVHLTVFSKDGKLRSHITDATKPKESPERYPWSQQFAPSMIEKSIQNFARRWIRPKRYHPLSKVWLVPRYFTRQFLQPDNIGNRKIALSLEGATQHGDIRTWKRVRIRDLLKRKEPYMAISFGPTLSIVFPTDTQHMIRIPYRSWLQFQNFVMRAYGFDRYLEYVEPKLEIRKLRPKDTKRLVKSINSKGTKSRN